MLTEAIRDQLERVPRADNLILRKVQHLERLLTASLGGTFVWKNLVAWMGYQVSDLTRRAAQAVLRDHHTSLLRLAADDEQHFVKSGKIRLVGRKVDVRSGVESLSVSASVWFRGIWHLYLNLIYFFGLSIACSLAGLIGRRTTKSRLALFLGPGLDSYFRPDEKLDGFQKYCEQGPVECLRLTGIQMIVHDSGAKLGRQATRKGALVLTRDPLRQAAYEVQWSFKSLFRLAFGTLCFGSMSLLLAVRFPWVALLLRDLGRVPYVRELERSGQLESVILTNSAFNDQELWMNAGDVRRLQSHMIWYSTNTRQFRYRDSRYFGDHPSMSYLKIDHGWVWNSAYADWVKETMSVGNVHVCGPILYRLRQAPNLAPSESRFDILIFDVTPVSESWFSKNYILNFYYYYQTANVRQFIEDILGYGESGTKLRIGLKHKRGHQQIHDPVYLSFIQECEASGVELIDPREDVFALIRSSRVSIAMPFSAPVNAAGALGFPAIYYDPTGLLMPADEIEPGVTMVQSKADLYREITRALAKGEDSTC